MTPELWQRLKPLFHAAMERDAEARVGFAEEACGTDAELKRNLLLLIEAQGQALELPDPPVARDSLLDRLRVNRFQAGEVILGRFRIVRLLGRGGMGEVFEAEDLQLGRIALKTLRPDISGSPQAFKRFLREVDLARKISGPQVCRVHELFPLPATDHSPAAAFLTMEYLEGETLTSKLEQSGPLPRKEALTIALDICEGLRLIHERGIIHRDLKSSNIMLCQRIGVQRAVLMDFGLAIVDVRRGEGSNESTMSVAPAGTGFGAFAGTPAYMAPEQFEGRTVSPASDIYALGVVLYELLTGLHPYAAATPVGAAIRRAKRPAPVSSVQHKLPRHWDHVVERCLEFDPEMRFQSAEDVARALRSGSLNFHNLAVDRPWALRTASALALAFVVWCGTLWWRGRQYYRPTPDAQHLYLEGLDALREGTYVKAIRLLEETLRRDPGYSMAHARMAEALADLDFHSDAQRELLIALPHERTLSSIDRLYLDAIQVTISGDYPEGIKLYSGILARLPAAERSAGNVDLGMAYERSGDIDRALTFYATGATLDTSSPAPYMHTAVLQSRLLNAKEANQAFDSARKLFTAELNQEGLAELDYEEGYALNVFGKASDAKPLLQQALDEADKMGSFQLQVRALTQLSNANYLMSADNLSSKYQEANAEAERAQRIAQDHRLDSWLADGLVRRANVRLVNHQPEDAEDLVREAMLLINQTGQARVQAMAELTLASVMNQERHADKVIPLAEAARGYYQKHGYLILAAFSSLLVTRAQRDLGQFQQALSSGLVTLEIANRTGMRRLIMQSEEAVGSVYGKVERYPEALPHYQRAASFADKDDDRGEELLRYANALWQIGRYRESDAVLDALPATQTVQSERAVERSLSLLSQLRYKRAEEAAGLGLRKHLDTDPDSRTELIWNQLLAQSHSGKGREVIPELQKLASMFSAQMPSDVWKRKLSLADAELAAGRAMEAKETAIAATNYFKDSAQPESELRSAFLAAAASEKLHDSVTLHIYVGTAVDILSELKQTWGPDPFQSYLTRPDTAAFVMQFGLPLTVSGR
jgi:tetratricopeptide (TPR) repeat protein